MDNQVVYDTTADYERSVGCDVESAPSASIAETVEYAPSASIAEPYFENIPAPVASSSFADFAPVLVAHSWLAADARMEKEAKKELNRIKKAENKEKEAIAASNGIVTEKERRKQIQRRIKLERREKEAVDALNGIVTEKAIRKDMKKTAQRERKEQKALDVLNGVVRIPLRKKQKDLIPSDEFYGLLMELGTLEEGARRELLRVKGHLCIADRRIASLENCFLNSQVL
jgi:hypothetical protein